MSTIILFLFPLGLVLAASTDLLTMKIPNSLILYLVGAFAMVALLVQLPLDQLAMHGGSGALVLVIGFTLFALGWIGGGDAKLAAVTALWLGFENGVLVQYVVYAGLLGGALTLGILALRGLPLMPVMARHAWIERLHDRKNGVPYGVALAIAGLLAYSNSTLFARIVG